MQCRDGVERGRRVFYRKVGVDADLEEQRLAAIRGIMGPTRKLRIDANQSWSPAEASRLLSRWRAAFRPISALDPAGREAGHHAFPHGIVERCRRQRVEHAEPMSTGHA